jgi:nucleotide-binding universal stress UspA family protein
MKILIATDGSETAIAAARKALLLLSNVAEIILLSVVHEYEDPMEDAGGFEGPLVSPEAAEAEYQNELARGREALEQTQSALGQPAEIRLVPASDHPGHAIVEIAKELHPDLIVLGRDVRSFFQRLFSGSVSDYVVHNAPCPVLIVPHDNPGIENG